MSFQFAANLPKILEAQERAANLSKISSTEAQLPPVYTSVPSHIPIYLILHFFLAHVLTATRLLKSYLKIDHNANPREDIAKYAEPAAKAGKISARQLGLLKRMHACHQHLIEYLPVFFVAVLFAGIMGEIRYGRVNVMIDGKSARERLDECRRWVNWLCAMYTAARTVFIVAYLVVERGRASYVRSLAWWAGNIICWLLIAEGGRNLNANVGQG